MNEWAQSETERVLANVIRLGVVAELDEKNARVKVRTAGLTTDWLPWVAHRAGPDRTWSAPEPGEQVVLLSPYGDLGQAIALPGVYQDKYGAPADKKTTTRTQWKDGAFAEYDRDGHKYQLNVPEAGEILLKIAAATLSMKNEEILAKIGGASLSLKSDKAVLKVGGSFVEVTGGGVKVNGARIDLN